MGVPVAIGDIQPFAELASRPDSVVYKAYQRSLDRVVLLKVVRHSPHDDPDALRRFAEGARLVARVQNPNVVAVFDFGEMDGQAYLVSEFVEGTDLAQILAHGPLSPDLALFVLHKATLGLDAAHRKGVLHRDIKPANILLSDDGQVKLADFGMASLLEEASDASEVRGTLAYLSPEQIRGDGFDARSDLFSIGATFFEMLTGRQAFTGAGTGAVIDAVLNNDPVRQLEWQRGVTSEIQSVARRLLAKSPADRFASAAELARLIESALELPGAPEAAERLRARVLNPSEPAGPMLEALPSATSPSPLPHAPEPAYAPDAAVKPASRRWHRVLPVAVVVLLVAIAFAAANGLRRQGGDPVVSPPEEMVTREAPVLSTESVEVSQIEGGETRNAVGRPPVVGDDERDPVAEPAEVGGALESTPAGIAEAEGTVEVPPETPSAEVTVEDESAAEPPATLIIVVDPWADVFVDGTHAGRGRTQMLTLTPGMHEIRLEHSDFATQTQRVQLAPGARDSLALSFWETMGSLVVLASPWAEVDIDGESQGEVPRAEPFLLKPGEHRITLRNPALGAKRDTLVRVVGGATVTLRVTMDQAR